MKIKNIIIQKSLPFADNSVKITKKGLELSMLPNSKTGQLFHFLNNIGDDMRILVEDENGHMEIVDNVTVDEIKPARKTIGHRIGFKKN